MQISNRSLGRWFVFAFLCRAVLLAGFASASALAQSGTPILPGDLYSFSGDVGANAKVEPVAVSGQSFSQAYRVTVGGSSANVSDAGLAIPSAKAINQGDNLQLTFWVRKIAPLDIIAQRLPPEVHSIGIRSLVGVGTSYASPRPSSRSTPKGDT